MGAVNWLTVLFVTIWALAMTLLSEALIQLALQADVGEVGFIIFAGWEVIGIHCAQLARASR